MKKHARRTIKKDKLSKKNKELHRRYEMCMNKLNDTYSGDEKFILCKYCIQGKHKKLKKNKYV